jgi:hypothetical protein
VKEKDFIECTVIPHILGGASWYHKDTLVFHIHPDGRKEDLRKKPPYLPMTPCPHCDAFGPKVAHVSGHDPLRHVDPSLGVPVKLKDE